MGTRKDRLSDVATIQAMPNRRTDSTRYGIWIEPMEHGRDMLCPDPCNTGVGDESISSATKYLNRKC